MHNAITMRGGIAETLKVWGIKVTVETSDKIFIPPYTGEFPNVYARVTSKI